MPINSNSIINLTTPNARAFTLLSGATNSHISCSWGRVTEEGFFGIAGSFGDWWIGSAPGDMFIGSGTTTNRFAILAGGGAPAISIKNARVGIRRDAVSNNMELEGDASKTTSGSWLANSDIIIKKDIIPLNGDTAINKMKLLQPVEFRYKDSYVQAHPSIDPNRCYFGFVAQEFQQVFPCCVKAVKDRQYADIIDPAIVNSDGLPIPQKNPNNYINGDVDGELKDILSIDIHASNIYLVSAVKRLIERVETLEATISTQQTQINDINTRLSAVGI